MKRILFIIFLILLLAAVVGLPIFMRVSWHMADPKPLNIFILDKTVLNDSYQEHLSLNWVLKNQKYVKPDGGIYLEHQDYYGFFPDGLGGYTIFDLERNFAEDLEVLADEYDMVYYTDLYGIYWIEWHNQYPHIRPEAVPGRMGERSQWIYGGLTGNELAFLRSMKDRKKLIINEFNIIASPTSYGVRQAYEETFDMRWENWTGRFFNSLDTTINQDIPLWLIRNYMEQNNNQWPFKKAGIAFVRNDDKIVVLEHETHLTNELPYIHSSQAMVEEYGVAKTIRYPYWFDIISTGASNEVLAEYRIEPNSQGDSILHHWGIPKVFPAVIKNKGDYPYYYFAGDFADNPINLKSTRLKYIEKFDYFLYAPLTYERRSFFGLYYRPLVTKILDDYYREIEASGKYASTSSN
ncbi:MAG: hypothetical protein RBS53_09570 [Bacteroidales bacterium]|jgi:hypothetical protein|nr:hypothetical protein [Bacteroidales bacterium]NLM91699.1 hypothetical protein [Bacteroidales bacterium]